MTQMRTTNYRNYIHINEALGKDFRNWTFSTDKGSLKSIPLTQSFITSMNTFNTLMSMHKCILSVMIDANKKKHLIVYTSYLSSNVLKTKFIRDITVSSHSISSEQVEIIWITRTRLSSKVLSMLTNKQIPFQNWLYRMFFVSPKFTPFVKNVWLVESSKKKEVCDSVATQLINLPKIFKKDRNVIFLNGDIGDIVAFETVNPVTGSCISYRVVVPDLQV